MKFVLTNAFSINMLERLGQDVSFVPVSIEATKSLLRNEQWESAVGHKDTAAILSAMLGAAVPESRINVQLRKCETSLIVAQYKGPRLPEGTTVLPEGATIEFWQVYHTGP